MDKNTCENKPKTIDKQTQYEKKSSEELSEQDLKKVVGGLSQILNDQEHLFFTN